MQCCQTVGKRQAQRLLPRLQGELRIQRWGTNDPTKNGLTLPETNSSHLKMDGWKMNFPFEKAYSRGPMLVLEVVNSRWWFQRCFMFTPNGEDEKTRQPELRCHFQGVICWGKGNAYSTTVHGSEIPFTTTVWMYKTLCIMGYQRVIAGFLNHQQ